MTQLNVLLSRRRMRISRDKAKALQNKRDKEISTLEIRSQLTGGSLVLDLQEEVLRVPKRIVELFERGLFYELVTSLVNLVSLDTKGQGGKGKIEGEYDSKEKSRIEEDSDSDEEEESDSESEGEEESESEEHSEEGGEESKNESTQSGKKSKVEVRVLRGRSFAVLV